MRRFAPFAAALAAVILAALPRLAGGATFQVNVPGDAVDVNPGNGVCDIGGPGFCTLRAAIMEANALAGADTIQLGVDTFVLSKLSGPDDESQRDLDVLDDLTIQGTGMRETVIDAQGIDRVFEIDAPVVVLSGLTIRGGRTTEEGGGIKVVSGVTQCQRCRIAGNQTDFIGGGVYGLPASQLVLEDSLVEANVAGSSGGGIDADGDLTLARCQILDNRSGGNGGGVSADGTLLVAASTVARNRAASNGGGFNLNDSTNAAIDNSTVSSNEATNFDGGGFMVHSGAIASLHNVTVAGNFAGRVGGGVRTQDPGFSMTVTAMADNAAGTPGGEDCSGPISSGGNNLFETGCFGQVASDIFGDPGLLPLGNHGGPTLTQEMSSSASALFNAGNNATCEDTDQRGLARPRSATCDIGSTELYGLVPVGLVIDPGFGNNGVLEPDEEVVVRSSVRSVLQSAVAATGALADFDGPPSGNFDYVIVDGVADYGTVSAGATKSCSAEGDCYRVRVQGSGVRPLRHWDTDWTEDVLTTAVDPEILSTNHWLIHVGASFSDLATTDDSYPAVETAFHHGLTAGCGGGRFCPGDSVTRSQLAFHLVRARHGELYVTPTCDGNEPYDDVPVSEPFCREIAALKEEGITQGCGGNNFCPANPVRRGHAARLLLRAVHGAGFNPGGCDDLYSDTAIGDCAWAEAAVTENLMELCAAGKFCPDDPMTREQLASVLTQAFDLKLYTF